MKKNKSKKTVESVESVEGVSTTRIALGSGDKSLAEANEIFCKLVEDDFPELNACMIAVRRTWELSRGSVCESSFLANAKFTGFDVVKVLKPFWQRYSFFLVKMNLLEPIQSLDERIFLIR